MSSKSMHQPPIRVKPQELRAELDCRWQWCGCQSLRSDNEVSKSQIRCWALGGIWVLYVSQTLDRLAHSQTLRGGAQNTLHSGDGCCWSASVGAGPGRVTYLCARGMKVMWEVKRWPLVNRSVQRSTLRSAYRHGVQSTGAKHTIKKSILSTQP